MRRESKCDFRLSQDAVPLKENKKQRVSLLHQSDVNVLIRACEVLNLLGSYWLAVTKGRGGASTQIAARDSRSAHAVCLTLL